MTKDKQPDSTGDKASAPLSPEEQAKRDKAEELDNWAPFDVHKWSEYPEVDRAVNEIYATLKKDSSFTGNDRLRKKHVKVIVLDLYAKWQAHPERYSGIYLRTNQYKAGSRYNAIHISKLTPKIITAMERHGYLDLVKGHYGRSGSYSSHMSRIRATQKLLDLILDDYGWTPKVVQTARSRECIELRDYDSARDRQVEIEYIDTPETIQMRKDLTAYNNLIRRTHIDIPAFPKEGVKSKNGRRTFYIPRDKKFTRRVFSNGSWEEGGRYYGGWWQSLPNNTQSGRWRTRIYINGSPVHERDYSGLHIVLLYAQEGIDYWSEDGLDPYSLPKHEQSERMRELLKLALLIAVNAKDKEAALKGLRGAINEDYSTHGWVYEEKLDLENVIEDFAERHKPIKHQLFSGSGIRLQRLDSDLAEQVINNLTAKGIPVLPVHDSFVVPIFHMNELESAMDEAFRNLLADVAPTIMNSACRTKEETTFGEKVTEFRTLDRLIEPSKVDVEGIYPEYGRRLKEHRALDLKKDYYVGHEVEYEVETDKDTDRN